MNDHFLEIETLGELALLAPGAAAVHTETWNLFQNVELPITEEARLGEELKHYLKG
ncbi:hypothetical protein D3C73_1543420 [compost metagenome]